MKYILISGDCWPVDTDEQISAAEFELVDAGLTSAEIWEVFYASEADADANGWDGARSTGAHLIVDGALAPVCECCEAEVPDVNTDCLCPVCAAVAAGVGAWGVVESAVGAGGWDVSVSIGPWEGEVTLRPSDSDGSPSAWGRPEHWCSHGLLAELGDGEGAALALQAIEHAAAQTILASGIAPGARQLEIGL